MENKNLINILVKDMSELEGLISDIKKSRAFDLLEMEFLQTKATGIRQLLQIFQDRNLREVAEGPVLERIPEPEIIPLRVKEEIELNEDKAKVEIASAIIGEEITKEELPEELKDYSDQEEPETETEPEVVLQEPEILEREPEFEPEPEPEISEPEYEPEEPELEPEPEDEPEEPEPDPSHFEMRTEESDDVDLQEPTKIKNEGQVLGETFQKEKSVNEMVYEGGFKLEHKLSQMPIVSIKSVIGINDRFLFTRELFDGDPHLYNEAVSTLDKMNEIKEAVAYLRDNFKWKKNETSLKFVDLVKRRFMNE